MVGSPRISIEICITSKKISTFPPFVWRLRELPMNLYAQVFLKKARIFCPESG